MDLVATHVMIDANTFDVTGAEAGASWKACCIDRARSKNEVPTRDPATAQTNKSGLEWLLLQGYQCITHGIFDSPLEHLNV
jgi:hypothetical protein